jgi:hypothetical protein
MNPPNPKLSPVIISDDGHAPPGPSLRRIVRKSALLNLMIVLTSCPVLLSAGGLKAVYPTLAIMAGISVLIWTATFAVFSLALLPSIFRLPDPTVIQRDAILPAEAPGVDDRWLDAPV